MASRDRSPGVILLGSDFKALGVIRSLGKQGIPSIVIDNLRRSAWFSRYVVGRFSWSGPMEGPDFLQFLLSLDQARDLDRWFLIPVQDEVVGFVAQHAQHLGAHYRLATPSWEVVRWALDKRLTYQMAHAVDVPYPVTRYPASCADLASLDIRYPVIVKPAISTRLQYSLRLKALPARNLEELRAQYGVAREIMDADEVMIQEVVPGHGEAQFSVAAYCKEGQVLMGMTARRTRQYPIDYGLSSSFVEAIEIPELLALAERLLAYMRVTGMVEVEFKHDQRDGTYKLLDINVRPWGWHALCIACGLDFPYVQYRDLLGHPPAPTVPQYGRHWVRLLTDIPAGWQEVYAGIISPAAYLRSLTSKGVFSVMDWRDPLPALGDFGGAVSRLLHPTHGRGERA